MTAPRIAKLNQLAAAANLDCVAIMPGPNMQYFTGLSFHLSERPTLALFPRAGQPALILPAFEASKLERSAIEWRAFTFVDGQDPLDAFQAASETVGLSGAHIGVEALTMRVRELRLLQAAAPGAVCDDADQLIATLRMIKDRSEIDAMRRAIQITEDALDDVVDVIRTGMTERQVANELLMALMRRGAEGIAFEPLIQSGPNAALPHLTSTERVIQSGEGLLMDFGILLDGYNSDITRTFAVGEPSPEFKRIYDAVMRANAAGRAAAKPGASGQDIDRATRKVIEDAGYGQYFTHRTGHGLGLQGHEPPYIVEGNDVPLVPGNTFTVEPGIYIPGVGGVRIEDDVLITDDGAESLTTYDRELTVIG
ncbi:MAG: aminopeptidase P family protein [Chloroflexi bacterium]|nr:aminopeptidase P family protein [Chloroflexota bacterium]